MWLRQKQDRSTVSVQCDVPRVRRLLGIMVLLALVLRSANLTWGIPISATTGFYHADEVKAWSSTVEFPESYMTNSSFLYGTAVQNVEGLLLWPIKLAWSGDAQQDERYRLTVILFARCCSILLGTLSVVLVFQLGRVLWSARTGWLAAALLAVAPAPALNSTFCTLDVPMSFLLLAGWLLAISAVDSGGVKRWVMLGAVAGVLAGTKLTGMFFLAMPFVLAGCTKALPEPEYGRGKVTIEWASLLLIFLPVAGLVFCVSSPQVVLDPQGYIDFMLQQKANWYDRPDPSPIAVLREWAWGTGACLGPVTACLSLCGLVLLRAPRRAAKLSCAGFVLGYYLFWQGYLPPRFVIFVAPLLCLFAGNLLDRLFDNSQPGLRGLGRGLFAIALSVSAGVTLCGIYERWTDARTEAAEFLQDRYSSGTRLGIATDSLRYNWRHHQWRYPPVDFKRYSETHFLDQPDVLVVTSFEIDVMRTALESEHLDADLQWDPARASDWYQNQPPTAEVFRFYRGLLEGSEYELVRRFEHFLPLSFGGIAPTVFVYERRVPDPAD